MENLNDIPPRQESTSNEFTINPETGMLVSHSHEYANTARMRKLIKRSNVIRDNTPPVEQGHVRLWRGNRPDEIGDNPSFTNSLEGIALPFLDVYKGELSYVDVPEKDLDKYVETGATAPGAEFILPVELAKKAAVLKEISNQD